MREVFCVKLKKNALGLSRPPLPGEMGMKVYEHVSKEAWDLWLGQQTIIINEYRLSPLEQSAREMLLSHMTDYLFNDKEILPEGLDINASN